jgi:hypothetical protein
MVRHRLRCRFKATVRRSRTGRLRRRLDLSPHDRVVYRPRHQAYHSDHHSRLRR